MFSLSYLIIYYTILIFLVPDVYGSIEGDSMSCTLSFVYVCAPRPTLPGCRGILASKRFPHASQM